MEASGGTGEEVPPLVPVPRDRPLPLSFSQEAIWFFQELAPGMKSYNFQASFRLRGALDADALGCDSTDGSAITFARQE